MRASSYDKSEELKQQTSFEIESLEVQFNQNLNEFIDEPKEIVGSQSKILKNIYSRFKRQSCIFPDSASRDLDYTSLYHQLLSKEYVDLRNDINSSAVIHILMKAEKNKLEQNFIKNAIQGLQLFENHKNLLTAEGFGNHLLTQMKVEYHSKNSIVFHYGDYGQKYYILLKGSLDLLMPKSEFLEENAVRNEQFLPSLPYFDEARTIPDSLPDETFEQYSERVYPKMGFVKTFYPGEAFGEIALMTNQQRTGSIIAREDSYTLVITKVAFHELLGKFHEFMQSQKFDFIQQFFFLRQIPKAKLLSIIQSMKILNFQRNNVIYSQNQSIAGIYFIKNGEVQLSQKIVQIDEDNQDESQKLKIRFRNIKKSEKVIIKATNTFFGEEEIMLGQHYRNSKAICLSETCEIFLLPRDILSTYGRQYNVVKKLKQNYDLKLKWEQERTQNIQNVQKQNQENINNLNQKKEKEITMSKIMLQDVTPQQKQRLSFNNIPPAHTYGSDEQIETSASTQFDSVMAAQQSSKKTRKFSYNMETSVFSSPQSSKIEQFNSPNGNYFQPASLNLNNTDRNNHFHLQNGLSNSILQRQQTFLSPQPTQMSVQVAMTPETSYTGRKSIQANIFRKNSSKEDILETYSGFGDNQKDKIKQLKQSMTTHQLRHKNSSLDSQFGPSFSNGNSNPLNVVNNTNNNNTNNIFNQNNNTNNTNNGMTPNNQSGSAAYHLVNTASQNLSQNNSRETSAERLFFDSSHNEFESMLKKQTQMKQEILKQISKAKNPNLDALTEVNKQRIDFKIRKQAGQYIPTTPKTTKNSQLSSASLLPSSSKISQAKSQTFIPLNDGSGFTEHFSNVYDSKMISNSAGNIINGSSSLSNIPQMGNERVVVMPASMANQKIQLNFFSTKVQGNQLYHMPSLEAQNIQQFQQQQILEKQQQPQLFNQPSIQASTNQPTLYQLDPLLEVDDENSPLKIGKKIKHLIQPSAFQNGHNFTLNQNSTMNNNSVQTQNLTEKDYELQKNAAFLTKKFQLGKKVVKYIQNRKSFNDKLIIDLEKQMKTPQNNQNTFNQFDEYMSSKQSYSPINGKNDNNYPQKEVLIQVKVHKRGGSILQTPTHQIQQQQIQQEDKLMQNHKRRFTYDISNPTPKMQSKKEQQPQYAQYSNS